MKFKSRVDWWMHLIFVVFVASNIWMLPLLSEGFIGIIIVVPYTACTLFLMLPIWLNTYYYVGEEELHVKSGLGKGTRIGFGQIISIRPTKDPTNAPALSLDRLEIKYRVKSGSYSDTVLISPNDEEGFIEQILVKNPDVSVSSEQASLTKSSKVILWFAGIVSAVTLVGVLGMYINGEREPIVAVSGDSMQIRAMYGTSVELANISEVMLIDQSMREIGAGTRLNGYNGGAWRGHFTAGLLFVRPDAVPTVRIVRERGSDIFISFRADGRAAELYEELRGVVRQR